MKMKKDKYNVMILIALALLCGCARTSTPHTGTWGTAQDGVSIALQAPSPQVAQGSKLPLHVVLRNASDRPITLVRNPYVTINISVNGKPDGDMIGNVEFSEQDIMLSPGDKQVCLIETFDTARWSGTCHFSGGINIFGDGKPFVPVGDLTVRVK
jgi:hypothetical protein